MPRKKGKEDHSNKWARIYELLTLLDAGTITLDEFHAYRNRYAISEEDIDNFCQGKLR